eukprot:11483571-Alexandrium_andersonii.AAC.1
MSPYPSPSSGWALRTRAPKERECTREALCALTARVGRRAGLSQASEDQSRLALLAEVLH